MNRVWLAITALVVAGLALGTIAVFSWTIDETRFDRPDAGFDRFTAEIESLPGVSVDTKERWVEAPTFVNPTSWITLTVDQANLPGLLDTACASEYTDPVTWSLRVQTNAGDVVSLHTDSATMGRAGESRCLDVGFDALALVDAVDRVEPGVDLQAAIWDDGRFALVALEEDARGLPAQLPLVAHADELQSAAGIDPNRPVEINSASLILIVEQGEHARYLTLLSDLAEEHGVTSFWADGGGTPIDGIEKVQIVAPDANHAAIEDAIRASGLHIADLPVRFIPQ